MRAGTALLALTVALLVQTAVPAGEDTVAERCARGLVLHGRGQWGSALEVHDHLPRSPGHIAPRLLPPQKPEALASSPDSGTCTLTLQKQLAKLRLKARPALQVFAAAVGDALAAGLGSEGVVEDAVDCTFGAALSLNVLGESEATLSAFRLSQRLLTLHPRGVQAASVPSDTPLQPEAADLCPVPFPHTQRRCSCGLARRSAEPTNAGPHGSMGTQYGVKRSRRRSRPRHT